MNIVANVRILKKIGNLVISMIRKVIYKRKFRRFGNKVLLQKPMSIVGYKYISIGENVVIAPGLRIEAIDLYNKQKFEPNLIIENGVSIGQNCHITCAKELIIGKNTAIMPNVMITDITHPYSVEDIPPLLSDIVCSPTKIGENCMIGYGSAIMPGTLIGNNCVVGANSVVTHSIPDYCVVVGAPAHIIKVLKE